MKKAVVFDLDGTLLNSLEDLAAATNAALRKQGFPERTVEEVRQFLGNGVTLLIHRSVPAGTPQESERVCLEDFRTIYFAHMTEKTLPYPGIRSLLEALRREGFRLAVVSNKLEEAVQELCRFYFGDLLDLSVGDVPGCRKKPAPDNLLRCLEQLQVRREEVIYVGDSPTDIQTAENTGVDFIGVLWGFRGEAEMRADTQAPLVKTPGELLEEVRRITADAASAEKSE